MLVEAWQRFAVTEAAVFEFLVAAADDNAVAFQRHYGSIAFDSQPGTLFPPVSTSVQAS